jgi:hypothetical protein
VERGCLKISRQRRGRRFDTRPSKTRGPARPSSCGIPNPALRMLRSAIEMSDLRTQHSVFLRFCAVTLAVAATACSSGGPYGFSRSYSALDAEEDALDGSVEYDPVAYERPLPSALGKRVNVFGVVQSLTPNANGTTDVLVGVRALQGRNLCETDDQESCRVTISEAEFGKVYLRLKLRPENVTGVDRLAVGGLVRAIGPVSKEPHPKTGATMIDATYYRVWPMHKYVTTQARSYMLR